MIPLRLWRYLSRSVLVRFFVALAGLFLLYATIDVIELGARASNEGDQLLACLLCRTPFALACIAPMALCLSAMVSLAKWRTDGEWDVLLGSGIPSRRVIFCVAGPIALPVALLGSWLMNWSAPASFCALARPSSTSWWSCPGARVRQDAQDAPSIVVETSSEGAVWRYSQRSKTTEGRTGIWRWTPEAGWYSSSTDEDLTLPCHRRGDEVQMARGILPLSHLTLKELGNVIETYRAAGRPTATFEAQLALGWSISLAPLALTFLGLAWGARLSRLGQGQATLICLAAICTYWVCACVLWQAVGRASASPWFLSIGLPASFGGIALGLLLTRRR